MNHSTVIARLLFPLLLAVLAGCAGPTRPDIPDQLPGLAKDRARIVFTREKQIAGAGSPIIVVDIGENIEPNAMVSLRDFTPETILARKNLASIAGAQVDFLWFDKDAVHPRYCADNGPGCIVYHWNWPKQERGGLLFGNGVVIRTDCTFEYGWRLKDESYAAIMRHVLKPIAIPADYTCADAADAASTAPDETATATPARVDSYRLSSGEHYLITATLRQGESIGYPPFRFKTFKASIINDDRISRHLQVIGSTEVGETLIWDRKPGVMRLGTLWYDGVGFMPENLLVEAGKTYFIHYTTRLGQRWALSKVE